MKEIIINNVSRCRKFGYGVNTQPKGINLEIEEVSVPKFKGSLNTIKSQMNSKQEFINSISTCFKSQGWFYNDKKIVSVCTFGILKSQTCECEILESRYTNEDFYCHKCSDCGIIEEWGEGWFDGTSAMNKLFETFTDSNSKGSREFLSKITIRIETEE